MKFGKLHEQYAKDQRNFFDNLITNEWSSYQNDFWDYTRRHEVRLIVNKTNPQTILNVGSGCGFHEAEFARNEGVTKVIGVDYSQKSIETANRHYHHPKVERICLDILSESERLNTTCDLVVSFQVIEHVEDQRLFLTRMKEFANQKGWVVLATPNFGRLSNRVRHLLGREALFCDPMHFQEFSISDLKKAGEEVGLVYVDLCGYGFSFNFKHDLDKYIPNKILFLLGRFLPRLSNVMIMFFKKA